MLFYGGSLVPEQRTQNLYVALIADIVGSRRVGNQGRAKLQENFEKLISTLNRTYEKDLLTKFAITSGDEFQGLIRRTASLPDLLWDMEYLFPDREFRVGIGRGSLDTPLKKQSTGMDGPAFHNARAAIGYARKEAKLGGVFLGFGELDEVLNGMARLLRYHRSRFTAQQRRAVSLLRTGMAQVDIAARMDIKPQSASKHLKAAGWLAYKEGEDGFRSLLRVFVDGPLVRGGNG